MSLCWRCLHSILTEFFGPHLSLFPRTRAEWDALVVKFGNDIEWGGKRSWRTRDGLPYTGIRKVSVQSNPTKWDLAQVVQFLEKHLEKLFHNLLAL